LDEAYQLHLAAIVESSDLAILSKTLDGVITNWMAALNVSMAIYERK